MQDNHSPVKPAEHEQVLRCAKEPHRGEGHLHAADDDSPFYVDGVRYCGRCHVVLLEPAEHEQAAQDARREGGVMGDEDTVRWHHWERQLEKARREGMIEGLVIALQILDADHPGESQRIAAEIERLRGEA